MTRLIRALSDAIAALRRDPRCTDCGRLIPPTQSARVTGGGKRTRYAHDNQQRDCRKDGAR